MASGLGAFLEPPRLASGPIEEAGAGRKKTPQGVALCRRRGRGLAVRWEVLPRVLEVLCLLWVELGFPWLCPWLPLLQLTWPGRPTPARWWCFRPVGSSDPGPTASLRPLPSSPPILSPWERQWARLGRGASAIRHCGWLSRWPRASSQPCPGDRECRHKLRTVPSHTAPFPGPGVSLCALWAPHKAHAPPLGHVAQVAGSTVLRDGHCGGQGPRRGTPALLVLGGLAQV